MAKKKQVRYHPAFIVKEVVLGLMALASIGVVILDLFGNLSASQHLVLDRFDFVIAFIFLLDLCVSLLASNRRSNYLKHNWYILLASIPITELLTKSLRGLRVIRLLRILRAGEHLNLGLANTKKSK